MATMRYPARLPDPLTILMGCGTLLYPFLVYFGLRYLPPGLLVALVLGLGGLHVLRRGWRQGVMPHWSLLFIPCAMLALLALRPVLAVQAYPPLVNLGLAATFAWSLLHPPSAIERIARLTVPDLPPEAVAYTRTVTKVWMIFFLANAAIATICAVWFTVVIWSLWTGLVSYVLIGALFTGELIVRRRLFPQSTPRTPRRVAT